MLVLICEFKPELVFIDPVSAPFPNVEKSNPEANEIYQEFRKVIRYCGCSIVNQHHRKKPPSPRPGDSVVIQSLEDDQHPRGWFLQARGASVLVNGADVRLGVDLPGTSGVNEAGIALVLRGYGRVRGEVPTIHLARVFDEEGEPLGYKRVTGVQLLCNVDQQGAFIRLADRFTFKDAMRVYGRADQATNDFLRKCIAKGILRKPGRGVYEKAKRAE